MQGEKAREAMPETRKDDPAQYEGMRLRLIDSTLEVVGQVGLENLTIRKVSEYAGVSVGLVHHHFENKGNLVYKTFVYLIRRVREQLTAGRRGIADPVARMKFTADMCFSDEVMSPGVANVWPHMWSSSAHDKEVQRLCAAFSRRLRSNFIHDLRQAGCDPTMATIYAIQAMGLVHGLWIEHRVAAIISIDEVLDVFHGFIDNATNQIWKRNIRSFAPANH
ncbi:TetR family transcriptional regulator C-terminal domain-containing protein [Paraburkholderia hospita]|uniref:TetR family transcriptional regulator n=1 Tax=Paraburkholderia hospita TaxID=169430 RepID=A0AAN1MR26_9BURK|nr:TetR family transcriptional regulator C-terminal domain-containing protein [Paraburkholderia hospita]AUT76327.1 TetR family transcriptional regulator [Paraburkholderia hospita]OUL86660.1 TetR family transcriptional regulator [Paraburkholderia hospita]SEI27832.1 transcriptional regulator, TetR family [Paraburkholderia hospita]